MAGMRPIDEGRVGEVLAALKSNRDKALLVLGIATGFRASELLSLKVGAVLTPDGEIASRVYVARRSMKGKREGREVPVREDARAALKAYLSERQVGEVLTASSPLFESRKGGSLKRRQLANIIKGALAQVGIFGRYSTHSLRKTFAVRVQAKTKDIFITQVALGHKSPSSTVAYLSPNRGEVEAAILAIA